MRDLISDLLESERLASPHAALQREPVDLAALVREVVAEHAAARRASQLDLAAGLPPLPLDRTRVRLLVRNLLDNALRHSADARRSRRASRCAPARRRRRAGGARLRPRRRRRRSSRI